MQIIGHWFSQENFREQQHEFIISSWHNRNRVYSHRWGKMPALNVCCHCSEELCRLIHISYYILEYTKSDGSWFILPSGRNLAELRYCKTQTWDTITVCSSQQTDLAGHPEPGGFHQHTGWTADAATLECTHIGKKNIGKTPDLLTHFILLLNEANNCWIPGTSHKCVVEI